MLDRAGARLAGVVAACALRVARQVKSTGRARASAVLSSVVGSRIIAHCAARFVRARALGTGIVARQTRVRLWVVKVPLLALAGVGCCQSPLFYAGQARRWTDIKASQARRIAALAHHVLRVEIAWIART